MKKKTATQTIAKIFCNAKAKKEIKLNANQTVFLKRVLNKFSAFCVRRSRVFHSFGIAISI